MLLTRVKCLVSMTTPRDIRLHGAAITPSFVEFDMSCEGFGCMYLPSIAPQGPVTPSVVSAGMIGGTDQTVVTGIGTGLLTLSHCFCRCCRSPPTPLFSSCNVEVEEVMLDDAGDNTRRVREKGGYGVVCSRCAGWNVVGYRRRHAMPRLVVNVLSAAGKPASYWFHYEKATPFIVYLYQGEHSEHWQI